MCEFCDTTYAGNDGRLLLLLPGDIADPCKVLPTHASGNFHLHQDLSDDMELLMKTHANAKFVSKKLHRKLGIVHSRKALTYLSRRSPRMSEWLSYEIFTGGFTPPTPAVLRTNFKNAEHSVLTPHDYSNFDRYEREMQSVTVSKMKKSLSIGPFRPSKTTTYLGQRPSSLGTKGQQKRSSLWPPFRARRLVKYRIS
jgi:hypothetical protein